MKKILILDNGANGLSDFFYFLYKKGIFEDFAVSILYIGQYAYEISKFKDEGLPYDIFNVVNVKSNELSNGERFETFYNELDRFWTFGINTNVKYNYNERILLSYEYYYKNIIIKNKIDYILWENISNSFSFIFYKLSKKFNNTKFISISHSRIKNRFKILEDTINCDSEFLNIYDSISDLQLTKEQSNFIEELFKYKPYYEAFNKYKLSDYIKNLLKFSSIKKCIFEIIVLLKHKDLHFYQYGSPIKMKIFLFKRNIIGKIKRIIPIKYKLDIDILNDDYFFYGMHYHPESSTSVYAMDANNELENIVRIARLLPKNTYLIVKGHPAQKGMLSKKDLMKIQQIPFVRYIEDKISTNMLLKNAKAVFTCTGTIGFEALLLRKPLVVMGKSFFSKLPMVKNISMLSNFKDMEKFISSNIDENSHIKLLKAYFEYTKPGTINFFDLVSPIDHMAEISIRQYLKNLC